MAKGKGKSGGGNRHLQARIAFLEQAAAYLTQQGQIPTAGPAADDGSRDPPSSAYHSNKSLDGVNETDRQTLADHGKQSQARTSHQLDALTDRAEGDHRAFSPTTGGLPHHLAAQLRAVAQKAIIRLPPSIKHRICRRCSAVLIEGQTCTKRIENLSKGRSKPWADVQVIECTACAAVKRFPVGATRQEKKKRRIKEKASMRGEAVTETDDQAVCPGAKEP
jgi:ribonuclease P protein subunit RPR2